jgi:hypothetical protein
VITALAVLGIAVIAPQTRAGVVVNLDPTGGAGASAANVLNATGLSFAPGNTVAIGGGNLSAASVGATFTLLYDAILQGISTTGANGNTAGVDTNNANIRINGVSTTQQFVITAEFTEQIVAVNATTGVVTFAPLVNQGVNAVNIYAQSSNVANSATLNDPTAVGFQPNTLVPANSTLILSGKVSATNFTSSFSENTTTDPRLGGTPVPLNNFTGSTSYPTTTTIVGTGNTGLIVNVSSTNPNFFLSASPAILNLNFSGGISTGTPFSNVAPQTSFYSSDHPTGYTPQLGTVNGASSTPSPSDFLFQSSAAANFSIPEPSSISMALSAFGIVSLAGLLRRRKAARAARS